jgi:hypothetical protein
VVVVRFLFVDIMRRVIGGHNAQMCLTTATNAVQAIPPRAPAPFRHGELNW